MKRLFNLIIWKKGMKRHFVRLLLCLVVFALLECCHPGKVSSKKEPQYQDIPELSQEVNASLKSFLAKFESKKGRKVAVFDCDGTLIGQVPHYLADEALYSYASEHYKGKDDSLSQAKMHIVNQMLHGNNVGSDYIEDRIHFFAGQPADSVEEWGAEVYQNSYQHKFFPAMEQVVKNLQNFDFEIWIITASPELLYQEFVSDELSIPENRIIGVKSIVQKGKVSDHIIHPVPQDEGKAETIATFIETEPLFVAGNSMGDIAMIKESAGLKWIVNPDDSESESSLGDATLKHYAAKHDWVVVYAPDQPESAVHFVSDDWNVRVNQPVKE